MTDNVITPQEVVIVEDQQALMPSPAAERQPSIVQGNLSTKRGVSAFMTGLMNQVQAGGEAAAALIPWFCDNLSPTASSRRDYARHIKQFLVAMRDQGVHPFDVTGDHVRLYKEALEQTGDTPGTIASKLSAIRGAYRAFGEKGLVPWNTVGDIQAVKAPPVTKNSTPELSEDEAKAMLHAPDTSTVVGLRDYAMLFAYFKTACRCSAIAKAKVGDLERTDTDWFIIVTEKGRKKRRLPLLEAAAVILEWLDVAGIRDEPDAPLFPAIEKDRRTASQRHLTRQHVLRIVKKHGRRVGLDVDRRDRRGICTHSLRKTSLQNALRHGAKVEQVQLWAGHADIRTTQEYLTYKDEDAEAAARHNQIR